MYTGAVVGLERTFYEVTETVGVVEVCAIVYQPDNSITCPIAFPFDVSLSTANDTAGSLINGCSLHLRKLNISTIYFPLPVEPMDYTALSEILMFAACERRQCVSIIIRDDGIPEQVESFFVTLERTTGLDSRITLDPVDAEIEIIDSNSR